MEMLDDVFKMYLQECKNACLCVLGVRPSGFNFLYACVFHSNSDSSHVSRGVFNV